MIVLVYTHEVISTKSERKPLKSTIWLTDQITRKSKNKSLQNFQTWELTSLSLRKQQRIGLNGTVKSFSELFPYLRRKVELCCLLLTRQVYTLRGLLCRSTHEVLTKMAAGLLEVRLRLPVAFFFLFTWNIEFLQHLLSNLFVINKLRFLGQMFLVKKRNGLFYANKREL